MRLKIRKTLKKYHFQPKLILLLSLALVAFFLLGGPDLFRSTNQAQAIAYLKAKNNECGGNTVRNSCYKEASKQAVQKFRFETVIKALESIQREEPASSYHDFLHFLASERYPLDRNLGKLFSKCTSVYFNACYHGVVTGFLEEEDLAGSSLEKINSEVSSACSSLKADKVEGIYLNCIHGIGHALMIVLDNELPDALKVCDSFEAGNKLANTCYEGVFMENFPGTTSSDHASKYLKDDDILYPCNSLDTKYSTQCYSFLTAYLIFKSGGNLPQVIEQCKLFPKDYQFACHTIIGSTVGGNIVEIEKKKDACLGVPAGKPMDDCLGGVVSSFYDRFGGIDEKLLGVVDFCKTVDDTYKKNCYFRAGNGLEGWIKDRGKEKGCSRAESDEAKTWCLGVI